MNHNILNKYNIRFYRKDKLVGAGANDFNLGVYISRFTTRSLVESLLSDINLALDGYYHKIAQPASPMEFGADAYFGIINDDLTFSVYYENDPINSIDYPLEDIKEIFISWLEFITKTG